MKLFFLDQVKTKNRSKIPFTSNETRKQKLAITSFVLSNACSNGEVHIPQDQ
jgi:hypothetical protein